MKGKASKTNRASTRRPKRPEDDQEVWLHFLGTDVMAEYLDATSKISKAEGRGDKEVSLPTKFLAKWIPETIRMEDREVVEAWNLSCDAAGFPDKKIPVPETPRDPMVLNNSVDVGHALPLIKRETDSEEEGPF
jgi:hypothetical protein